MAVWTHQARALPSGTRTPAVPWAHHKLSCGCSAPTYELQLSPSDEHVSGGAAVRSGDFEDLQVDLSRNSLGPHPHGPHVLEGLCVWAVNLVLLARLDGRTCRVVPVVGEAVQWEGDGVDLAGCSRIEVGLVAVCMELTARSMRIANGEAETCVVVLGLHLQLNALA